MDILTLLIIAIGLSMDAFAVSLCNGMALGDIKIKNNFKIATTFGLFQGAMPLVGYVIASTFASKIEALDHWIAFILLAFIGGKMLYEALQKSDACENTQGDPASFKNLFVMGVATSIDALAIGASIAVMPKTGVLSLSYGYLLACLIIAAVTFIISFIGVFAGSKAGMFFGKKAEIAGGIILIGIGVKILIEHLINKY